MQSMYEAFFKFRNRPFASAPQTNTYFPAASIENARRTLERVIERGEGPGLVIGPPGTGKTMLCHLLAEKFTPTFAVALLSSGRLKTCQALLQAVHYELKLPYRGMDEGELRLSLIDFLEPTPDGPQGLLLLVDEAHTLPWRLLDEIRLITNLVRDGQPRVRVVLVGGPALEERFASPKLGSFAQRVAGRCYLEHFDRAETSAYVRAQISAAGGDSNRLVDEETLRSIFRATDGIPRLINQVCDHALVLASLGGHPRLSCEAIDEAWSDLQQLPLPWCDGQSRPGPESQIVEFGHLSDDAESMPEAIPFRASDANRMSPAQNLHLAAPDEPLDDQLDSIAEQLSEIDDGNEVSVTSEVELDFPEFGDPFSEEFAEEEVVLDRYRSEVEIFAEVPRVSSWEGRQLGSLLSPFDQPNVWSENEAGPQVRISLPAEVESSADLDFTADFDPVFPEELPAEPVAATSAVPPTALPPPALPQAQPPARVQPAAELAPAITAPRPIDRISSIVGQRPTIVVEEDPPVRAVPIQPRRNEFRHLFSKLRRG
jgi:type II secretory pathway predicted ATPase ExeA